MKDKKKIKFIITGYSGHGKHTVSDILKILGLKYIPSSMWMLKNHLWDIRFKNTDSGIRAPCRTKKCHKKGVDYVIDYLNIIEMYEDRNNHRIWWKDTIHEINKKFEINYDYLGNIILHESDIYCGLRDIEELEAIKRNSNKNFKIITVFVDASPRKQICKKDKKGALTIKKSDCDLVINNYSHREDLIQNVINLYNAY